MRCIIAGSRTIRHLGDVAAAIAASGWEEEITEVVSGCAGGADRLGRRWAELAHLPVRDFPADWAGRGKAAGPLRNEEMACYADALIAVWDGESRGTADMIRRARSHGLRVSIHEVAMKIQTAPPPARRTCVACELLLPPAADDAPLCAICAEDVEAARRRAEARIAWAIEAPRQAWLALNRAIDALPPDEAARWGRMREAIDASLAGAADEATRAKLNQARGALDRGKAPALNAVWTAYEGHYWICADGAQRGEAAARRLARLDAWIAAQNERRAA